MKSVNKIDFLLLASYCQNSVCLFIFLILFKDNFINTAGRSAGFNFHIADLVCAHNGLDLRCRPVLFEGGKQQLRGHVLFSVVESHCAFDGFLAPSGVYFIYKTVHASGFADLVSESWVD
jgi:hypothetical protein